MQDLAGWGKEMVVAWTLKRVPKNTAKRAIKYTNSPNEGMVLVGTKVGICPKIQNQEPKAKSQLEGEWAICDRTL